MINTKLILIDGIPCTGKSTTAHFIARQLEKNGIKTKLFHETDTEHPLCVSLKEKVEGGQDPYKFRLFVSYPEKLTEFVSNVINDLHDYNDGNIKIEFQGFTPYKGKKHLSFNMRFKMKVKPKNPNYGK